MTYRKHSLSYMADLRSVLRLTYERALDSPDPSTQNGAALCRSDYEENIWPILTACNEFPKGVVYLPERWERPLKYSVIEHAERNVIYRAAYLGIKTEGTTMVCPWAACADCARAIIQAGVKTLVVHQAAHDRSPDRWKDSIVIAHKMLAEANVELIPIEGRLFDAPDDTYPGVLHTGETWIP